MSPVPMSPESSALNKTLQDSPGSHSGGDDREFATPTKRDRLSVASKQHTLRRAKRPSSSLALDFSDGEAADAGVGGDGGGGGSDGAYLSASEVRSVHANQPPTEPLTCGGCFTVLCLLASVSSRRHLHPAAAIN
jgi:hypothetical protein